MEYMDGGEKVEEKKRTNLIVVLAILGVLIVGLGAGIVFLNLRKADNPVSNEPEIPGIEEALQISKDIKKKAQENLGHADETMVELYEEEMSQGSLEKRLYLSAEYAKYMYEKNQDVESAVNIVKRLEPEVIRTDLKRDYYQIVRDLYFVAGNTEQSSYYNEKVSALTPDKEPALNENTSEVENE